MNKRLAIVSLVLCLTLIWFQSIVLAASDVATIEDLRVSTSDDKVRIVADANKEVDYQSFALSSPNRVVVDLSNATLGKNVSKEIDVDNRYVEKIRVAQFNKDVVRIVVESPVKKNDYDVFGIVGGSSPYRVAMDFGQISYNLGNSSSSGSQSMSNNTSINSNNNSNNYKPSVNVDKNTKKVLKGKVITIDPGHGGSDSGAVGPTGLYEKTATLKIGLNVAEMLKQSGAKVYITRKTDKDVYGPNASATAELQARCDVGNWSNSDIFVSIHLDSFTSPSAKGTTGYYYTGGSYNSQKLATYVKDGIIEQIGTPDRGTKTSNFYVVKNTEMPATLVEVAFVSNPDEEAILKSEDGIKKAAIGIFNGIVKYFQS